MHPKVRSIVELSAFQSDKALWRLTVPAALPHSQHQLAYSIRPAGVAAGLGELKRLITDGIVEADKQLSALAF
jgi:hypothetical protein